MNESQMREDFKEFYWQPRFMGGKEPTSTEIADFWLSQFQQYKASLLSQIEEVRKPNPTDSLVDTFEEITSWRPHDDLVRKQYGEVIRDVKSFISEVRQKAVEETLRDVYKIICSTYGDFHEEEIEIYGKSKGIEL